MQLIGGFSAKNAEGYRVPLLLPPTERVLNKKIGDGEIQGNGHGDARPSSRNFKPIFLAIQKTRGSMSFQHDGIFFARILTGVIAWRAYGVPFRKRRLHNRNDGSWKDPPMVPQLSGMAREFCKVGDARRRWFNTRTR